jgi:hypothetical protein
MSDELNSLFDELVTLVGKSVPKAEQVSKYGGILFTLKPGEKEGQFCGVFPYDSHVQLAFSKGALLEDSKVYKLAGSGKYRRHINFKISEKLDKKELKFLIVQSTKL